MGIDNIMEILNQKILDCLKQGEPFGVATIMTDKGSTPRTSGSKMIVLKDRTIYGTIGGGIVEAMVIDASLNLIEQQRCKIMEFTLNKELSEGLDMVCGGSLSVLIETFIPNLTLISLFKTIVDLEKRGKKGFLVSKIEGCSRSDFTTQKWFADSAGTNPFPVNGNSYPVLYNSGLEEFIIETIHIQDKIYIFGAGHVGFQLAKMAHITDFQTIITDDRKEFANRQRFPHAIAVRVVEHFSHAFDPFVDDQLNCLSTPSSNKLSDNISDDLSYDRYDGLAIDKNSYIVILTRGHLHDQTVLEAALKTDAAYIGMIGSRAKRDKIYANLEKNGVARERLEKVYSPIGLDIHAETPAEIAVSIIGQIIKIRAGFQCS